jgi:hypothetical protein
MVTTFFYSRTKRRGSRGANKTGDCQYRKKKDGPKTVPFEF